MKNLHVTLAALVVWSVASAALVVLLPLEQAMPVLLVGLCLVPLVVLGVERIRRGARPAARASEPVAPPVPEEALTEENLRRVFGEANVAGAWAPKLSEAPAPVDALERFGGPPAFVAPTEWPRCQHCGQPLTFVGQVAVGPERPLRYPEEGLLYVFLCQRVDVDKEPSICWSPELDSGIARCFVLPRPATQPLALTIDSSGPRLSEARAVEGWTPLPSVRMASEAVGTPEQYSLYAAVFGRLGIQVGGFPDWVQAEETPGPCSCGAAREVVLQFDEFGEALNLGGAGRAYVFACAGRHAPDAFWLTWQTS